MRKVWIIARHEYLKNIKRPGFIIWTLLVPVLGAIGLGIAAFAGGQAMNFLEQQFSRENQKVGFIDHSGIFSPVLPEYQDSYLPYQSEEQGRDDLAAEKIDAVLIISASYMDTGQVTIINRGGNFDIGVADTAESFLQDHLLAQNVQEPLATRIADPMNPTTLSLNENADEATGGPLGEIMNFMVPYVLGILLVVSIFSSSGYLMRSVSEEKTSRVIEIVLSSVRAWELLAGKVLGLGAVGLTQIAVWLGSTFVLSGGAVGLLGVALPLLTRPTIFILGFVYYLLGFLIYAVLMGAGGALGTTEQESAQIAGMFSFTAAIPMMIMGFIWSNPNALLARILSWFPITAPTMMMMRITLQEVPVVDIVGSIGMCLLSIPLIIWAGSKVFRAGLLMYGKKPSVKEVWKIIRAA
jgi:ABC-2 type transport system permease protein